MRCLEFRDSLPRAAAARLGGRAGRDLGPLHLVDRAAPRLPGPEWVRVRPLLAGVCGSDLAAVGGTASPAFLPVTSPPFVPGHEVVGVAASDAPSRGVARGDRVVVEPALGCLARATPGGPCPACAVGQAALCAHVDGVGSAVGAGIQIGFCGDTGGGWGESLVAHESQLHRVPDALSDADAVLVEPLACAIHAVRCSGLADGERAVVIGAGTIGLLCVAAARALVPGATIVAVAKHRGQAARARALGADEVVAPAELDAALRRLAGGRRYPTLPGAADLVVGGVERVLDCVGTSDSIAAALRAAGPRATVALAGMPARVAVDLAPLWLHEIRLVGTYAYGTEPPDGRRTFAVALELMARLRLGGLVGAAHPLERWRDALDGARGVAASGAPKTVFAIQGSPA